MSLRLRKNRSGPVRISSQLSSLPGHKHLEPEWPFGAVTAREESRRLSFSRWRSYHQQGIAAEADERVRNDGGAVDDLVSEALIQAYGCRVFLEDDQT